MNKESPHKQHAGPHEEIVETIYTEEKAAPRREGYWHQAGGGSLAVSIMVHAVFIIIAIFLVIWQTTPNPVVPEPGNFMPGGKGGGGDRSMALQKQRHVTHAQPRMKITSVSRSAVALPNVSTSMTQMAALISLQTGGAGSGPGRSSGGNGGMGDNMGGDWGPGKNKGFTTLPLVIRSRCSPAERTQKMKENGGNDLCEAAVRKSLRWLQKNQNKDGSWGESHKAAMTGLALLAYLGHCETPESPAYGETVLKGLTYLMELAAKNKAPFDGIFSEKPGIVSSTYEHGIATYALGEMYSFSKLGTTPIPGLRECFEKGALIIINKQAPNGAWGYKDGIGYDPYGGNDLSVTGWQYQAIKAARHTNLDIPGLAGAVKKVERYLESKQTAEGGFGNTDRNGGYNQWNLTGTALLGLQTLGTGNAGKVSRGIRWLADQMANEPRAWNADCYLYTWYYDTQALFQKGGEPWRKWNDQFQKEVLTNQNGDGSYRAEGVGPIAAAGTGAAGADKDVYRACVCTLMLEVYYRYLKVGDRSAGAGESNLMPIK